MPRFFETEYIGKSHITSHFCRCEICKRLTMLSSYSTTRFAKLLNLPLFPIGKFRMVDECPQCGNHGVTSARKYAKERKRNLALMMEGFAEEADNPQNCAHALHTLMVYNMKSWFHDVQKSYGLRFETNMQIQSLIAQGLSRFGRYSEAMTYCRKAIVLGAGKQAEELLDYCQTLMDASEGTKNLEALKVQPESSWRAYTPMLTLTASAAIYLITIGVSSLQNYQAWIVNGSLESYSFSLDEQTYELDPGETRQITLKLGEHKLKAASMPPNHFTYSIPLIRQLLNKNLMIINPDAMALLTYEDPSGNAQINDTAWSYSGQIRMFPGLRKPQHGLRKISSDLERRDSINLYRPESHMAMIQLMQKFELNSAAVKYARQVLNSTPDSVESEQLLDIALANTDDSGIQAFLHMGMDTKPMLLAWHLYYQNHMKLHHPDHNLEREYTSYCKKNEDDPKSYYLLARVVHDRQNAYRFYEHSDKNGGMNGLGLYSIAHDLFLRGEFKEALPYAQQAVKLAPRSDRFADLNEQILLALRDYDTLLAQTINGSTRLNQIQRDEKIVLYLTCAGYHKEASEKIAKVGTRKSTEIPRLNAIRFYTVGNMSDYLDCLEEMQNPHRTLEKLLQADQITDADSLISQKEDHPYWEHLVLYCAAMEQHQSDIATRNLQKAIAKIELQSSDKLKLAGLLGGRVSATPEKIRSLDIAATEKSILCVALGYSCPELQQELYDLALTYNFTPAYPQFLIKKWVRNAAARTTPNTPSAHAVALGL